MYIPKEIFMSVTGKTELEIDEEEKDRVQKERNDEKKKYLLTKYGDMINLYEAFTYKNNQGEINSKFFNELPQKIIKEKFLNSKLTSTKIRQYYDMINSLYQSKIGGESLKSELYMILAKAHYDNGRNIIPKEFVDFLRINIDIVFETGDYTENFIAFKKHIESVVAYSKGVLNDK